MMSLSKLLKPAGQAAPVVLREVQRPAWGATSKLRRSVALGEVYELPVGQHGLLIDDEGDEWDFLDDDDYDEFDEVGGDKPEESRKSGESGESTELAEPAGQDGHEEPKELTEEEAVARAAAAEAEAERLRILEAERLRELLQEREEAEARLRLEEQQRQEELMRDLTHQVLEEHTAHTQQKMAAVVAEETIAQAQKTAELIVNHTLDTTKIEMTNVISQAYAEGFSEGRAEAVSIIEPAMRKIAALMDSVTGIQDLMLENFKDGMFSIISGISSKIIHREIESNDKYLIELFNDAVKSIKIEEFVTVTVSESQVDFAVRNADLFKAAVSNVSDFKVIADADALRGTMIVETARAIADSSYYVQHEKIDEVIAAMRDTLIIPQSAEEIAELEKIQAMREENLGYLNYEYNDPYNNYAGQQDYQDAQNLSDSTDLTGLTEMAGMAEINDENSGNVSDIDYAGS